MALEDGENELARKTLFATVRNLSNHIITQRVRGGTSKRIIDRIRTIINLLAGIGVHESLLDIERAHIALINGDGNEAIKWAKKARASAPADLSVEGEALDLMIKAHWQKGEFEKALDLKQEVKRVISRVTDENVVGLKLVLSATWLRCLCKAGEPIKDELSKFIPLADKMLEDNTVSVQRIILTINEIVNEIVRAGDLEGALYLSEYAYRLNENGRERSETLGFKIAIYAAEVSAQLGKSNEAEKYLGLANSYCEEVRTKQISGAIEGWESLNCQRLFMRGRVFELFANKRLLAGEETEEILVTAMEALLEAKSFAIENRIHITGDVDLFLADVNYYLGGVYFNLGLFNEAKTSFQGAQSESAKAYPNTYTGIVLPARFDEGRANIMTGSIRKASDIFGEIVKDKRAPTELKDYAKEGLDYLKNRLVPLIDWFESEGSKEICGVTKKNGLREAVAQQISPLVAWWREWHEKDKGPESELLDFWGRGGFARVAAAVRSKPHAAITADAYSVNLS